MADVIQLRGLRVVGRHGVLEHEQLSSQPFQIDLDVELDTKRASLSDDLAETVDYGALASRVSLIVANENHKLIERLAQRVADEVLSDERVIGVTVTLTKLRPPVPVDLASAAVCIHRP